MQSTDSSYRVPPFPAFPSISRYIPLGSVQEALGRVSRSIEARDAISLVLGPPGTGKSLICGLLLEHFRDSHEVVVLGETPIDSRTAFLRHLLHHLGADFATLPEGDLQLALIDRVCAKDAPEGGLLIIVDEAQSLSAEVIEAIRTVTNITRRREPRVFAVLCGGMKLDELLVEPSMEAFTQRVATRCYLHAMNADETRRYVTETIRNCASDPDETITFEAIAAVHHACGGVPRLVNQMMTQAIDCAEEAGQANITEQIVDRAWAQLQQLPSPMVEEPRILRSGAPIEFGELDESISFGQWTPTAEPVEPPAVQRFTPSVTDEFTVTSIPTQTRALDTVVDGTANVALRPRLSPGTLFGDFDEEEEVAVGNGFAQRAGTVPTAPPADLETILHQEIIGINTMADGQIPTELPAQVEAEFDSFDFEAESEEQVEEFIRISGDEPHHERENPVIWMPETASELDDICTGDDSQILIIEDEIELRRFDRVVSPDSKPQTVSVDFQAMLQRMRTGS